MKKLLCCLLSIVMPCFIYTADELEIDIFKGRITQYGTTCEDLDPVKVTVASYMTLQEFASEIEKNYKRFVYHRSGYQNDTSSQSNLEIVDAPYIEISSSFIRKSISEGKDVRHFLPPGAREYLDEMNFYR